MKTKIFFFSLILLATTVSTSAQTDADRDAVKRVAMSYAEGWYEGDAAKMESALSPQLAKRIARSSEKGESTLGQMTSTDLIDATRGGLGKKTPAIEQRKDVKIFDMMANSATVKLEMRDWVDYMHIARMNGKWVIVNVLWEMKSKK
ncbi:MAG: nuclear transport factor 2 family protein [Pyrinomonadaceae bacterium]